MADDQIKSQADIKEALEEAKELEQELDAEPVATPDQDTTQEESQALPEDEANPQTFDPAPEAAAEDETMHVEGETVDSPQTDEAQAVENAEVEESLPVTDEDTPAEALKDEAQLTERGGGKKLQGHIVINSKQDDKAHWYVVHTTSGHEARIAENLRQRVETMGLEEFVLEILIPTQDRVVIRGGKKYTVKEKIFPGYMIVKMILTDEAWLAVRTTQGVTGFVGAGNKPSPLSDAEVANITKFVEAPAARYKVRFSVGEAVRITDGPFSQFLGTINEMDEERGKVKVLVSIFGRETPVELDFLQIAKV